MTRRAGAIRPRTYLTRQPPSPHPQRRVSAGSVGTGPAAPFWHFPVEEVSFPATKNKVKISDGAPTHTEAPRPSAMKKDAPVLLGFTGRMVGAGERLDHYTTKVGGAPDWPASVSAAAAAAAVEGADAGDSDAPAVAVPAAPPEELTRCPTCSAVMALVVQAHAPLGAEPDQPDAPDRSLYLFTCFDPRCASVRGGKNRGRWRALRAQSPGAGGDGAWGGDGSARGGVSCAPLEGEGATVAVIGDDWGGGGGGDDWGGGVDGQGAGAGAEMDELADALDRLATRPTTTTTTKTTTTKRRTDAPPGSAAGDDAAGDDADLDPDFDRRAAWQGPRVPEFFLVADWEPASSSGDADLVEAERALARYTEAEGGAAFGESARGPGSREAAPAGNNEWAGEGYEAGTVDGLDGRYLKFSKRIRRAPEQCVRYAFGGGGLVWPADGPGPAKTTPRCGRCGAERRCEIQLMPPLLHFVAEAADWSKGNRRGGGGRAVGADQLDAWDWQTVAAFTCSKSCSEGSGENGGETQWTEEHVECVDGDGGIAELLKMGDGVVIETAVPVDMADAK